MTDGRDESADPEPIVAVKMARLVAADARVQLDLRVFQHRDCRAG